ncbi:Hypothetical protein R9X50_00182000 [Acrodontium crateriforme]|uniref:Inosine/uridine-preferring nucleoside hydrolase domain-containing protein n=1 Tax=Acrodontium crateriforme TaxID=150365 RepID=A0AAQ3M046_9PEZI|nr:Hypothetical protein R9X50_00182000 [Acrodontium crateriforme]
MAPNKIIIDTDPGVDDILALLLAFSALSEELEVLLVSVTYGNVEVQRCAQNVVTMFHQIEKEMAWRKANGRSIGFETLCKTKPVVAIGAEKPLADQMLMADYFHGRDGIAGISETHPELSPAETWEQIMASGNDVLGKERLFTPSKVPAHQEILRILRENEPDTVTIVAVGPLTNMALAAAEDPETFLRAKEVVVMGGAINEIGNITPFAEFNTFADSIAAARVYALSSPNPHTVMPPTPPAPSGQQAATPPPPYIGAYPSKLSRRLNVVLFSLDETNYHLLNRGEFNTLMKPVVASASPLATWIDAIVSSTFNKIETLEEDVSGDAVGLQMHDPLCIWYCITGHTDSKWKIKRNEDIRVETAGQWTRGMCLVDRRTRRKREDDILEEIVSDTGNWLSNHCGNRLGRCVGTPGRDVFGSYLLTKILEL